MTGIGCGLAAASRAAPPPARCTCWAATRSRWCCTRCGTARHPRRRRRRSWWSTSSSWCRCSPRWSAIVIWQRRREQAVIADQLPGFAQAGWIAPSEVPLLSTAGRAPALAARRAAALRAGRRAGGRRVPDGRHRAGVPARPDAPRGGRAAGLAVAQRGPSALAAARGRAMGQPEALTAAWLRRRPRAGRRHPRHRPAGARSRPATRLERRPAGWRVESPTRWATGARREAELTGPMADGTRLSWAPDRRVYPGAPHGGRCEAIGEEWER